MPRYFKSTANKPGGGVRKGYRRGGRNLRDEEARVIGVQDNAADELRRVRARRPHDAAERRDRRAQLSRVGSRERNARDEMARLRREAVGYRYGGAMGMGRPPVVPDPNRNQRVLAARAASQRAGAVPAMTAAQMRGIPAQRPGMRQRLGRQIGGIVPDMSEVERRVAELDELAIAQQVPMYGEYGEAQIAPPNYYTDQMGGEMDTTRSVPATSGYIPQHPDDPRPYIYRYMGSPMGSRAGGRVGFKKGGRIPRKKGTKFI